MPTKLFIGEDRGAERPPALDSNFALSVYADRITELDPTGKIVTREGRTYFLGVDLYRSSRDGVRDVDYSIEWYWSELLTAARWNRCIGSGGVHAVCNGRPWLAGDTKGPLEVRGGGAEWALSMPIPRGERVRHFFAARLIRPSLPAPGEPRVLASSYFDASRPDEAQGGCGVRKIVIVGE